MALQIKFDLILALISSDEEAYEKISKRGVHGQWAGAKPVMRDLVDRGKTVELFSLQRGNVLEGCLYEI